MSANTALIIVDVQLGMFSDDDPVTNGDELLANIGMLIAQARAAQTPIIFIQHDGQGESILRPDKPGWPIHPTIAPSSDEIVIRKRHSDSFQETNLGSKLENLQITKLVVVGVQTEYCVDTTCRRAYSLDYDVTLVQDGHTTWDTELLTASQIIAHHNDVLGGTFVSMKHAKDIQFTART